jgi:hypothetical protein
MASMAIDDEIFDLAHVADHDDMVLGEWSDDMDDDDDTQASQSLPPISISSMDEILMDFCDMPSLELLGYNEHGFLLPNMTSSCSSSTSSSDDSMDDDMAGSFLDRLQSTSRKLRESMKKSQESRKSLVLKMERTAEFAGRVEEVVKSVKDSTDKLQTFLDQ